MLISSNEVKLIAPYRAAHPPSLRHVLLIARQCAVSASSFPIRDQFALLISNTQKRYSRELVFLYDLRK